MEITPGSSRRHSGLAVFTFYLICLYAAVIWFGLQNLREQSSFNIADWLINYSGGFVRRGLIGSALLPLSRISHISPMLLVFVLQLTLFAVLYGAMWLLTRPMRWRLWSLALAFSPATLGFVVLVGGGAFRKELLVLVALAILLVLLRRGISDRDILLYLSFLAVLIALSHEALTVYWPYFLVAVAIARRSLWTSVKLGLVPSLLMVVLVAFAVRHPGNLAQVLKICSSVGGVYRGHDNSLCGGAFFYLGQSSAFYHEELVQSIGTNHYLRDYGILIPLSLLPCVVALWRMGSLPETRQAIRFLLLGSAVSLLGSSLLFIYTIDWGRWIYAHVFCLTILLFFISGTRDSSTPAANQDWRWSRKNVLSGLALVFYLVTWHVPVTGYEGRGWGYFGMATRHIQRLGHHPV